MTRKQTPRRYTTRIRPQLVMGGIAAASFSLTGCSDEPELSDARFTTLAECTKAGYPSDLCNSSYAAALSEHQKTAPSFKTLDECKAEWGDTGCQPTYRSGGSVFVPLMAGFVLSQLVQRDYMRNGYVNYYGGGYYGTPIYRNRTGNTVTVDRSSTGTVSKTPVNVNTKTVSTSGFGGSSYSRSGGSWGS
ncbi:MAG: DUF1190 domain-containing protein [Novosphingobium sp.]|nr:DUF1190 domain-containing protein [Novosphingobium sp.]